MAAKNVTELYQALRPLILREMATAGGAAAAGGGMAAHDLAGPYHTGTILESQAPWAASKVEWQAALLTHAALPDVHHAQAHVLATNTGLGADHTVTGLTARQVLRATSATNAAFGAIEDADLPGTIVRTSRQIIAGNGLTGGGALSADVTVTLGTPSTLTVSSTNAVTSTSHTHAITSSSNPGASASLLSTTAGGLLTLANLAMTGSWYKTGSVYQYYEVAEFSTSGSPTTGTIKITLPKLNSNTMMVLRIVGFQYTTTTTYGRGGWEALVSGYNSSGWASARNQVVLHGEVPFSQVRLCDDGSNSIILLGDTTSRWYYPKISVSYAMMGYSNLTGWETGWSITAITDETGITTRSTPAIYHAPPDTRTLTAGNGLEGGGDFTANRTMTLGTPSSLTATTTNAVTTTSHTHAITTGAAVGLSVSSTSAEGSGASIARADHTHAITSSSNPGAAASILASDASGNLNLQGLFIRGTREVPSVLQLRSTTNDSSWSTNDLIGAIEFYSQDTSVAGAGVKAAIRATTTAISGANTSPYVGLTFHTSMGTNDVERMRIDHLGNVAIGSTSPGSFKLHVTGAASFTDATVTSLTTSRLVASDGSDKLVSVGDLSSWIAGTANRVTVSSDGDGTVTLSAPQDIHPSATPTFGGLIAPWLRPASDSTTAVQIRNASGGAVLTVDTTNSRLGIGTTSPSYKLDVSGDIHTTGALYAYGGIVDFGTNYFQESTDFELRGTKEFSLFQTIKASGWSMSAGGALVSSSSLSAASLALTGAATIAGDLTVGGTVLQVSAAGTRVGINRAADQQFDLDVAGAIRGQYLVGPHALQLSDAKAIVHFDGPAPYNLDFSGTSNTHMGENATETGGVIYRPGKFGKAVQLAEATTNLVANPSFEADAIGATTFTGWNLWGSPPTREIATGGLYGEKCLRLITNGTNQGVLMGQTVTSGTTYTISFYVYVITGRPVIYMNGTGVSTFGAELPSGWTGNNLWNRYSYTFTATANGTCNIYLGRSGSGVNGEYLLDAVQFEQKAYATPYCDGSLGQGHSWSGTAHASTSSRTNATITYPANNVVGASAGTIMFWAKPSCLHAGDAASSPYWIYHAQAGSNRIYVRQYNSSWAIALGNGASASGGTPTVDVWTHLCVTWNNGEGRLFVDGQQVGTVALYTSLSELGTLAVGYSSNGLIDDLILLDYAADPKLIRSIYESNAPVFAESSVVSFRAPTKSQIWVDEFGFWAKGQSGGEAFGIFGGDPRRLTTTKSWGGVTMEENDIVIGRTSAPSYTALHWDDSAGELILGRQSGEHISLTAGYVRIKNTTTTYASLNNAEFILGNVAEENLRLTTSGIEFRNATEVQGSLSGTSWTLGKTGTGENNVQITPTTLSLRSGENKHAELTSAGVLTLGLTSSGDYVTIDGTNGVRLYGNSSLLGQWTAAGGVVIGAVANSTSRIEITSGAVNIINRSAGGADTTAISLSSSGSATFTGQITATTGAVGGWTIGATSLTSGSGGTTVGIDSGGTNPAFYAGSATPASAPFRVTNAGVLTATSGTVGGWTISESSLTGGSATLSNTGKLTLGTSNNVLIADAADATYRLWIGHADAASAPFAVSRNGALVSTFGSIGGWAISSNSIIGGGSGEAKLLSTGKLTLGTIFGMAVVDSTHADWRLWIGSGSDIATDPLASQFRVSKQGYLTASGATIYGHLVANSGDIAGALTIGTSGGIYQGTGTFASPTTGLKIWNDSSVGRIGGYNAGTLQWYAGTDGKLYAGGGNTILDANGVNVVSSTSTFEQSKAYTFSHSGVSIGGLASVRDANTTTLLLKSNSVADDTANNAAENGRSGAVSISGIGQGTGKAGVVSLTAQMYTAREYPASLYLYTPYSGDILANLTADKINLYGETYLHGGARIGADPGGATSTLTLTNATGAAGGAGTGTVKMNDGTNRNNNGFIKMYVGTTAVFVPYWTTIAG